MKKLAITGSSGSGKTTISNLFLELDGTFLINTDELARKMSKEDAVYLNEIVTYFGNDILNDNGSLNRKKLSYIIATNEDAKKELNKITKKNITPKIDEIISQNQDKELAIVDVPVLYENGLEDYFDIILAVTSNRTEQIKRICSRDGLTEEEAVLRLNMQLDNSFFEEHANYIVYNYQKSIEELKVEIEKIYNTILGRK